MKRFQYPLSRLLLLRNFQVTAQQAELRESQERLAASEAALARLDAQRQESLRQRSGLRGESLSVVSFCLHDAYLQRVRSEQRHGEGRRHQAEEAVDRNRRLLQNARNQARILERHRDRLHTTWQQEYSHEEQRQIDEAASATGLQVIYPLQLLDTEGSDA